MGSLIRDVMLDMQAYGVGVTRVREDGSIERLEPMEVYEMAKKGKPRPKPKPRPSGY